MNTEGIFDSIIGYCDTGGCFFIDGRAGRGKIFLVSSVCDRVRGEGEIVYMTSTSPMSVIQYHKPYTAENAKVGRSRS